ncbi:MAG: PqqD family protein [Chloroflexi bacterium]|nr:PqqD family protein [Chloroflexota bacterium]MCI0580508.1 PqqD family protein [Chloroflexota bacterium]MCI0643559.1 PqqD family protein [Chloroflexota bacterium]MCI0729649.1 PqqD family protein [Chloroflexota bacterium]
MDANTVLKRSTNTTYEVVAGEAILIRLDTGTYFSLNKVGTQFWEMLDGQQSIGQHAATLAAQYDVETSLVAADLLELAGKMMTDNLVEAA